MLEHEGTAELKAFWLEKLHKAEDRYRIAILQTQKALDGYTSLSPSDGNLALRQALKSEGDATGEYKVVFREFTQLMMGTERLDEGSSIKPSNQKERSHSRATGNLKPLSRNEYQILVEQAPIMIWRANTTAECDYFNDRWLQFRGRRMEQEYGNQWVQGVHPGDRQRCLATYRAAFGKREPFEMEYRLQRHDGDYRWIFDRGAPFFSEGHKFLGYIGSCIDVTDRIEAQRTLDQARERELANLRGILPICMQCKKIKRADGGWVPLEQYIRDHSRADFTHGLCPECYQLYSEQFPAGRKTQ